MKWWKTIKRQPALIKLFNWEYWPSAAFYWPMVIAGPVMALRSRSACFFSAANPGIQYSGLGMESKFATLNLLPAHLRPKSILVPTGSSLADLTQRLDQAGISFPLIAKPDLGFRGLLVRKLNDLDSLQDYLKRYSIDFIVQEFLDHPEEVGVFYYRYPGAAKGTVASVTLKEFLKVTGDGRSTVRQLIMSNPRALLQLARLEESHAAILDRTPQPGETINLGEIGNHSKGTVFINGKTQIDDQLTETFDRFCKQIDGFYYGRFDIKCRNLESLKRGEDFKIIELNGINAEPTHIYDPNQISYWGALRTIVGYWSLIRKISSANHHLGVPYDSFGQTFRAVVGLNRYIRRIKRIAAAGS